MKKGLTEIMKWNSIVAVRFGEKHMHINSDDQI